MPRPGQQQQPSRLRELLARYPPTTLFFTAVCVALYVLTLLVDIDYGYITINPYRTAFQYELYRIYTSAFFHGGIMHIAMNMMSFQALGTSLEALFGSTMFFLLITTMIFTSGVLYVGTCVGLAAVLRDMSWLNYQSVGFSGVLFSLAALECFLSPVASRSIFGLITVPTKLYPWALLVVLQVMMPNISLVGHLAGLVVGLLYCAGKLHWTVPSFKAVRELEEMPFMDRAVALDGFVRCPDHSPVHAGSTDSRSTLRMAWDSTVRFFLPVWRCFSPMLTPVYHVVCTPVVSCAASVWAALRQRSQPSRRRDWGGGTLGDGSTPSSTTASTREGDDDPLVVAAV